MSRRAWTITPLRESAAPSAHACGHRWTWRDQHGRVGGHCRTREMAEACVAEMRQRYEPTEAVDVA